MRSGSPVVDPALNTLLEATSSLVSSPELAEVLSKILKLAELLLEADAYAVWRCRPEDTSWHILYSAGVSDEYKNQEIETGVLPTSPVLAEDVETVPLVTHRRALYQREGIKSFIAYPLRTSDGSVGTVTFYFRKHRPMDAAFVQTGQLLANISNAAINAAEMYEAQKILRRAAQRAADRAEFQAHATTLLASSLDYSTTLNRLAQLAVSKIADWCAVYVIEAPNRLERIAVAHSDPAKLELAREYNKRFPPDLSQTRGVGEVIRQGKAQLVPELSDELLRQGAYNDEHYRMLKELGMRSVMVVPLISREIALGALVLVTAESGRIFAEEDLEIARSLATRAAVAIDNARLYEDMSRAKAHAQLREEELRLVQESAKVASWSFDLDSQTFSFSTDDAGRLLGRGHSVQSISLDEFSSLLFFSTDQNKFRQAFAALEKGKKELQVEVRVATPSGSVNLLAMRGKLFFNSGQNKVLGVLIDLTRSRPGRPERSTSRAAARVRKKA